jgi:hypothetical protein
MDMSVEALLAEVDSKIQKAVTATTYAMTPSSRSIYAPENLDPTIKHVIPMVAPVRKILPRTKGEGQIATWRKLTSRLDPQTEVILGEEDILLNGDTAVTATEFDGFAKSFTTNSGSAGYVTSSGIGTYSRAVFDQGSEQPTNFVASAVQMAALANDLQGSGSIQRIVVGDQGAATGGVHLTNVVNPVTGNLIELVTSRYSGSFGYLLTVTDVTGQNWLEMEDLEPISVYDVPTANHSIISRVFETSVLKVIAENFQMKVGGLSLT